MADDADSGAGRRHPGEDLQIRVGELSGSWQRSSAEHELLGCLCDLQEHREDVIDAADNGRPGPLRVLPRPFLVHDEGLDKKQALAVLET
jgi:hypothetical protein